MQRVVLATNNQGKLRELQALLQPLAIEVLPKSRFTQDEVAETGASFIANALIKARHAAAASGLPAIADDSGIEVDALGGAPGIYSARYAGAHATDLENLQKLLQELKQVPDTQRTARYRCALAYVCDAQDTQPLICEAAWEGRITHEPHGSGGFGYDPIFHVPQFGCTAAELSVAEKNRVSHRAQALHMLLTALRAASDQG
ncbi:MAG: RdgB/HAM1 family non-canonical purine NTP pyrophosphatase [Steroidobacteraceae bacterium]